MNALATLHSHYRDSDAKKPIKSSRGFWTEQVSQLLDVIYKYFKLDFTL